MVHVSRRLPAGMYAGTDATTQMAKPKSTAIGHPNGSIEPRLSSHQPSNTDSAATALRSPMSSAGSEDLRRLPAESAITAWTRSNARIPRKAHTRARSTPGLVAGNRPLPANPLRAPSRPVLKYRDSPVHEADPV